MIYSTSIEANGVDYTFVSRQTIYLLLGLLIFFIVSRIDYKLISSFSYLMYALVIALLLTTFFYGEITRGSRRWIDLGIITIQASEVAKPVIILTLSSFFSRFSPKDLKNVIVSFLIVAVPAALVFIQPDLGNAVIIMSLWAVLVFGAGVKILHAASLVFIALVLLPLSWFFLEDYQKERLLTFLSPERDPHGSGYNLVQSIIAVGSGGLKGRGFGRGTQSHLNFLPEQKTDFIFATTAEELGFFGVSIILGAFGFIIYRTLVAVNKAADIQGSIISLGVAAMIAIHLFINIGMNIGIFPVTGITLPLISFGGSSLISVMFSLGLVNSVSSFSKKSH